MAESSPGWVSVSITELEPRHLTSIDYRTGAATADLHDETRRHFERVAGWVAERGHDVQAVPRIGVLHLAGGQLADPSTAGRVLNAALDSGISFLDTAACYDRSEEWIGRTIAHRWRENAGEPPWRRVGGPGRLALSAVTAALG